MTVALVFVGAMIGAPLRYVTDRLVQARHETVFPWGTLTVNIVGCFVLGALGGVGTALPGAVMALLGTGLCGGLTTYSTFGYETIRLLEERSYFYACANVITSVVAGVGVALLGYTAAHAIVS